MSHLINTENSRISAVNNGRRRFIRTTAGAVVLAATGSATLQGCSSMAKVPDSAISAWSIDTPAAQVMRWSLSHAILAPNPHNLQPWLVDLSKPGEMLVAIDPERLLPETDPYGRQIMIGTGAMLGLFELAAATQGYATSTEWIASGSAGESSALQVGMPVLRVRISRAPDANELSNQQNLFAQIPHRHTVRGNYDLDRSPSADLASFLPNLQANDQHLGVLTQSEHQETHAQISSWVKQAWEIELATPATAMESVRLLRIGRREIEKHRDGIVIDNAFLVVLNRLGMFDRSKPMEPGSKNYIRQIESFNAGVDSTPAWFYITSGANSRLDQIEVGRTFVKAQLRATELGMVMHPVSQGLQEYSEMADIYQSMTTMMETVTGTDGSTVQMLARVGYLPAGADKPTPAPRRGVDAHLVG